MIASTKTANGVEDSILSQSVHDDNRQAERVQNIGVQ